MTTPLVNQVSDAIVAIGTETKAIRGVTGQLASLATTDKDSLVAAINELVSLIGGGGPVTADDITDATTLGKALIRITDAAAARTAIGAGTSNLALGTTSTTAKAGDYAPAAADISDSTTLGRALLTAANAAAARTGLSVYSSAETDTAISDGLTALVDGAPGTLNTLNEIAAALGDNPDAITEILSALAQRVATTASQGLDSTAKANARDNIDVYSKAEIGDIETDLAAVFAAAIAP